MTHMEQMENKEASRKLLCLMTVFDPSPTFVEDATWEPGERCVETTERIVEGMGDNLESSLRGVEGHDENQHHSG